MGAGALSLSYNLLDFKTWAKTSQEAPVTRVPTFCNGCGNRCAIFAFVKNGRLWKIEGNPEANGNLGVVCPRGHGYIHDLYNPDRIRSAEKGWRTFEPISWEQAYQEISQKINLILMDNGPQSIFWVNYPQSNQAYALRLMHSLGSPHYFTHGSTCYTARNAGWNFTVGKLPSNDLANSRYHHDYRTQSRGRDRPGRGQEYRRGKGQRGKVGRRRSRGTAKPPSWPMNGSPSSPERIWRFLLAMINVMVNEKLYDREFVEKKTVGFPATGR